VIEITKNSFDKEELLKQVESELMHIPKFIRDDVAEAIISQGTHRSYSNNKDYGDRLYILECAINKGDVENRAIRLLLVESIIQEMKIKSLEHRINRLEIERIATL
jgi:hypothetical protein